MVRMVRHGTLCRYSDFSRYPPRQITMRHCARVHFVRFAGGEGDDVQGLRLHRLHAVLALQVEGPHRQVHPRHQEVLIQFNYSLCSHLWSTQIPNYVTVKERDCIYYM